MEKPNLPSQSDTHVVLIQESDVAAKIAIIRGLPVIADADVADDSSLTIRNCEDRNRYRNGRQ